MSNKQIVTRFLQVFLINSFFLCSNVFALPEDLRVPGGIAIINLGQNDEKPNVNFNGHKVAVISKNNQWLAIVGLALQTKIGEHQLLVNGKTMKFTVSEKKYPQEHLTVASSMVQLSSEDKQRIKNEQQEISSIRSSFTPATFSAIDFIKPTAGALSSRFGLRRYFNGQARNPHSGLDFRGGLGAKIIAPYPATVVRSGNYFFGGNTVFLDHGQGLISLYMHLSKISVTDGMQVNAGDQIGEIGATGRATGPHLHWTVYLNNSMVDPELFLTKNAN